MKTKIQQVTDNTVRLQYTNWMDEDVDATLFVPSGGGYVFVLQDDGSTTQICDRLSSTGSTLIYSPQHHGRLVDMIRKEYRKMRAAEKRDAGRL